jgi:RNA 3'-terminal phosphate cyclase (ATP)
MAYYRQVKLPLLRQFGLEASVEVERAGFYPTGGGEATLTARPSTLSPLTLERRGDLERVDVYSTASEHLEDAEVADRQADEASAVLSDARLTVAQADVSYVPSASPGSAITVAGTYERSRLGADELGERGRPSEDVGAAAAEQFLDAHDRGAAVDTDMADQAMVYLALAGGTVQIPAVTDHVETNLRVIEAFDYPLSLDERDGRATLHAPPSAER